MSKSRLSKIEKAYSFFLANSNNEVTLEQISENTGWSVVTIKTYLSKKWKGFISKTSSNSLIWSDFDKLSIEDFTNIQTQVLSDFIPQEEDPEYDYDVTLSFAGEDRKYVEELAHYLTEMGVRVFYDRYYEADLWGRNLYTHLDEIYQNKSLYCIMFLSKHYRDKVWTNHERESAQARAFREKNEYILPVKFDETEIPGIRGTIGYIDGNNHTPQDLSKLVLTKLGLNVQVDIENLIKYLEENLDGYSIQLKGIELEFYSETEEFQASYPFRLLLEMYRADMIWEMFILPEIVPN
jgi:hypothetical protein